MKSFLPHLAWLVIAAAAFAFGKYQGTGGSGAGRSAGLDGPAAGSKVVRPGAGARSDRGSAAGERGGGRMSAAGREVSSDEIKTAVTTILGVTDPIEGEKLRHDTVANAVREWMRRDPAAAGQWVEGAGLPESVVTDIKQPRDDRRWRR